MNKKEVLEIRKQFTPENCAITRIAGCYVDGEKEERMEREEAFLSLPEEQAFKYFDIFKKTLSGNIGNVPVMASNICDNKVVNIQVPEGKITIDADFISNLEIKVVDGRKCMVLPVDCVEINGISTKA